MNTDNIVIDALDKLLQQEEIPADNFKETLQQVQASAPSRGKDAERGLSSLCRSRELAR